MKNKRPLILPAVCLLLTGSPLISLAESVSGDKGERYVIQKGDTLWDIAGEKMGDPFRWPELWKSNPYIVNPDLIYPGNPLLLRGLPMEPVQAGPGPEAPVPAVPSEAGAPPPAEVSQEPGMEPSIPAPLVPGPPPQPRTPSPVVRVEPATPTEIGAAVREIPPALAASGGSILREVFSSGVVEGSPEEKTLFGEGDRIFIRIERRTEVGPGDLYTLYRPVRQVIHPKTRQKVGNLIEILGTVKIDLTEGRKGVGTIIDSYDHVTAGDRILSLRKGEEIVPAGSPPDRITGILLASLHGKTVIGQHDVIYLDKGAAHGLAPALRFSVRRGEESVGEIQILSVQKETATLLVTRSFVPLEPGDEIVLQKP